MTFNRDRLVYEIGRRLRKLREQFKFSPNQMAAKLGLSQSGYFKNEHGRRFPGLGTLNFLQGDWDISMDWFIFNKGPVHYKEKLPEPQPPAEPGKAEDNTLSLDDVGPDERELLEYMGQDRLLKHEVLVYFYKYKEKKEHQKPAESPLPGDDTGK